MTNISEPRKNLIVSALFHDVGKFYKFRTGSNHIENSVELFKALEIDENALGVNKDKIIEIIKSHHGNVESFHEEIIRILIESDRDTSKEREEEETDVREKRVENPLLSPISILNNSIPKFLIGKRVSKIIEDIIESNEKYYEKIIANSKEESDIENFYNEKNWKEFLETLKVVSKTKDFNIFISNSLFVLFDFLKFIPSSVRSEEGRQVPLFDHLKLTAALTAVRSLRENKIRIVAIDLGGIQDFIFKYYNSEEARKGATKRIRGRSCLVSLVSKLISIHILKELGLPLTNEIISTAGRILLIVGADEEKEKLEKIEKDIEKFLFNYFKGDLKITMIHMDINSDDLFKSESFSQTLEKIEEEIEAKKQTPFSKIINDIISKNTIENSKIICEICGNIISENECELCKFCEEFGREIPKNDFIGIKIGKGNAKSYKDFIIGETKYTIDLDTIENYKNSRKKFDYCLIFFHKLPEIFKNSYEYLLQNTSLIPFFEYAYTPIEEVNGAKVVLPISLSDIEEKLEGLERSLTEKVEVEINGKKEKVLFNKLSILYIDVDNLGKILNGKGVKTRTKENKEKELKIKENTISKYVTLSFFVNFFFSVIGNVIAKKHNIYIVFSGGDDVRALGSPYEMFNYYLELSQNFIEFFSESLTFSGGILLQDRYVPLLRLMELVESLERAAKSKEKASIAFDNEKYIISIYKNENLKKVFDELINKVCVEKAISTSSIYKIFSIAKKHVSLISNTISESDKFYIGLSIVEYILKRNWKSNETKWEDFFKELFDLSDRQKLRNSLIIFISAFSIFYLVIKNLDYE